MNKLRRQILKLHCKLQDILENLTDTISSVSSLNSGNVIATHDNGEGFTVDISETVTTLSVNNNILEYTREDGTVDSIDLSLYLDDTNLAMIVSGTLDPNTGIATFTRDNGSSFTIDYSSLLDNTDTISVLISNNSGNVIATHDNGQGNTIDIEETVTSSSYSGAEDYVLTINHEGNNTETHDLTSLKQGFQIGACAISKGIPGQSGLIITPTIYNAVDLPISWGLDSVTGDLENVTVDNTTGEVTYDIPSELQFSGKGSIVITAIDVNNISVTKEICLDQCILIPTQYWLVDNNFTALQLENPSFEEFQNGFIPPSSGFALTDISNIVGWQTTASDQQFEIWRSGFNGVTSLDGDYFVEMNANEPSRLFQRFTVPKNAGTLNWSVWHRNRVPTGELAEVIIGLDGEDTLVATTVNSNTTEWTNYSGSVEKPCGVEEVEVAFNSISTSGSLSVGNFLDLVELEYKTFDSECNIGFIDCDGNLLDSELNIIPENTYTLCIPACFEREFGLTSELISNNSGNVIAVHDDGSGQVVNIEETITNLTYSNATNILSFQREDGNIDSIDLSGLLDNINLPRIVSSSIDNLGIATFTRDDSTTFTLDLSSLLDNENTQNTVSEGTGITINQSTNLDGTIDYEVNSNPILLNVTQRIVYVEEYAGRSSDGQNELFSRNSSITRTALGQWDVTLSTPHPEGSNYIPNLFTEEQSANRDTPDITVVQGSITNTGFSIQITTGDNGTTADSYVDTPWGFSITSPITITENVSL